MEMSTTMDQNVSTLFANIESFTQDEGTLGKPLSVENKTLIPVISVTLGYGGGNSAGKMSQNNTNTAQGTSNMGMDASGIGARISTDAVVVVDGSNVSVVPINNTASNMTHLINKLPQMFGRGQQMQQDQTWQQSQPNWQQGQQSTQQGESSQQTSQEDQPKLQNQWSD